jgi:hypothetical protein
MKPHQNPAEFILEVTGAGIPKGEQNAETQSHEEGSPQQADGDNQDVELGKMDENYYVEVYKHSQFFADTTKELEAGIFPLVRPCRLLTQPQFPLLIDFDPNAQQLDEEEKTRWAKIKARLVDRYASTYWEQFARTMKRAFLAYWRKPDEFLQKVSIPLVLGVVIGTYFVQLNDTQQGAAQRGGMLYFSLLISNLLGIRTRLPRSVPVLQH